jgi:hypothetical protein
MSGWIKVQEGEVVLIHHSASSTIELFTQHAETGSAQGPLYLDYYDAKNLLKALKFILNDEPK